MYAKGPDGSIAVSGTARERIKGVALRCNSKECIINVCTVSTDSAVNGILEAAHEQAISMHQAMPAREMPDYTVNGYRVAGLMAFEVVYTPEQIQEATPLEIASWRNSSGADGCWHHMLFGRVQNLFPANKTTGLPSVCYLLNYQ
jgi:hypothetical protein